MYKEQSVPNFVENEHEVQKFWDKNNILTKYLNKNKNA